MAQPVSVIVECRGADGLAELPGIGRSLSHAIEHLVQTGRLPMLERLRGEDVPERLFGTVAGIGPELAQRIHDQLGIETLVELEAAARDGRLATVAGMGQKRLRAVRESLSGRREAARLAAAEPSRVSVPNPEISTADVPVSELLDVDEEYRRLAHQGKLPRIAPRRFNPLLEAWLPVLHTQRSDRHYTALFSNTARAHELGTIRDWVVIYRDDHDHGRWTVITAQFGPMQGRRIVRGRENECAEYYVVESSSRP